MTLESLPAIPFSRKNHLTLQWCERRNVNHMCMHCLQADLHLSSLSEDNNEAEILHVQELKRLLPISIDWHTSTKSGQWQSKDRSLWSHCQITPAFPMLIAGCWEIVYIRTGHTTIWDSTFIGTFLYVELWPFRLKLESNVLNLKLLTYSIF